MKNEDSSPSASALREGLRRLSGLKLFFGHQSVGRNILDGLAETGAGLGSPAPAAVETKSAADVSRPAIYHAAIGANADPRSKIAEFGSILRSGMADEVDAAFMKFCYVDVDASTDVDALFREYRDAMAALKRDYPRLAIVHFTVPLTVDETGFKAAVKAVLGRGLRGHADNLAKERYNALLRAEYEGKEPVFDIARIEAGSASGKASSGRYRGAAYPAMRPEYSDDGGHLNAAGRRRVAGYFILEIPSAVSPRR